jgi:hypothetical protein
LLAVGRHRRKRPRRDRRVVFLDLDPQVVGDPVEDGVDLYGSELAVGLLDPRVGEQVRDHRPHPVCAVDGFARRDTRWQSP